MTPTINPTISENAGLGSNGGKRQNELSTSGQVRGLPADLQNAPRV
jgi:hypothetical protein